MKKCPNCNAVYPDEAVFCSNCGTQLMHANICPECGNELPENAKFCPKCGHKMFEEPKEKPKEEVKQEVVDEMPGENSRYTGAEIDQMKRELVDHRRRQRNFKIAGGVLIGVGAPLFVLGIFLFIFGVAGMVYSSAEGYADSLSVAGTVFGYLALFFGLFMTIGGIPLLVVASAVFGKKADNRERAIREYEGK